METKHHQERHFARMVELAAELRALPAEVLEHSYSYESFGSWWVTVRCGGTPFRVVFDGKEGLMFFEQSNSKKPPYAWKPVAWDHPQVSNGELAV